jgi:hypothetical protein
MSFGEYSLPTDTLAAILGAYPFSVGFLRELLQVGGEGYMAQSNSWKNNRTPRMRAQPSKFLSSMLGLTERGRWSTRKLQTLRDRHSWRITMSAVLSHPSCTLGHVLTFPSVLVFRRGLGCIAEYSSVIEEGGHIVSLFF